MFRVGKIDEDTVDCPRFIAFKGASREDSSSSFNLGQLTKRIHGESDEFDEEEARQAQRKDRRRRAPFYMESPIGFTFTWNRPLCAVLMLLGGGGGGGGNKQTSGTNLDWKPLQSSAPPAGAGLPNGSGVCWNTTPAGGCCAWRACGTAPLLPGGGGRKPTLPPVAVADRKHEGKRQNGACAHASYLTQNCHPAQSFCGQSWAASQNGFHWILDTTVHCAQAPLQQCNKTHQAYT